MKLLGWMVLMSVLAFRMETMRNKDLVSALVSDETEVEFENVRKILTSGWQRLRARRNGRRVLRR